MPPVAALPPPSPRPGPAKVPPTFSDDQKAFIAAVRALPHDPAKPAQLAATGRKIIDDCSSPMPKNTSIPQILLNAGASLPRITTCIVAKSR